ncbi:hypothetical protein WJX72_005217 [[Myrmecia] bisecta]|uniref:Uncharacterized protein n=1 Tax=[Myrmecia] bisecta TaxID=41462 RepID=A0AAW1P0X4_9CHLO
MVKWVDGKLRLKLVDFDVAVINGRVHPYALLNPTLEKPTTVPNEVLDIPIALTPETPPSGPSDQQQPGSTGAFNSLTSKDKRTFVETYAPAKQPAGDGNADSVSSEEARQQSAELERVVISELRALGLSSPLGKHRWTTEDVAKTSAVQWHNAIAPFDMYGFWPERLDHRLTELYGPGAEKKLRIDLSGSSWLSTPSNGKKWTVIGENAAEDAGRHIADKAAQLQGDLWSGTGAPSEPPAIA